MAVEQGTQYVGRPDQPLLPPSQKLPKKALQDYQRELKKQILKHPLHQEAARKNFKLESLSKPFEFEDTTEIVNNQVTFKLEKDKDNPKIRKFTVTKTFSLSGPMVYDNKTDDKGPFVEEKTCLTFNDDDPHLSYSWSISDNSIRPQFYEDDQRAVDKSFKFIEFLSF